MISTTGSKPVKSSAGYTYLVAIMAIAVLSITSATAHISSRYLAEKSMEQELLFQGQAYYQAIKSYYHATLPNQHPKRLEELIKDPRFLNNKRHIRQLYQPALGEWQLIYSNQGRITGVYYDSDKKPKQQVGFTKALQSFEGAQSYREWRFTYLPGSDKN